MGKLKAIETDSMERARLALRRQKQRQTRAAAEHPGTVRLIEANRRKERERRDRLYPGMSDESLVEDGRSDASN